MNHEIPVAATGLLKDFAIAQMITSADFHVARTVMRYCHEDNPEVELAVALTVRALREGSVCFDLATAQTLPPLTGVDDGESSPVTDLPWPEPTAWLQAVAHSPITGDRAPLVLQGTLLYLERYFRDERLIEAVLAQRRALAATAISDAACEVALSGARLQLHPRQREAVMRAATEMTTLITGGPGTGKTTVAARILDALAHDSDRELFVALAAPTGKAAGRLTQAVTAELSQPVTIAGSLTLYKLLGAAPSKPSRRYHAGHQFPYDVVIVDEVSMASLSIMAALLEALGPHTRLILLGDPHQLSSVEEGSVLADIAAAKLMPTVTLDHNHRSNPEINAVSQHILFGQAEEALDILTASPACSLVHYDGTQTLKDLTDLATGVEATANAIYEAARCGDGVLANQMMARHRILCAHREGRYGVHHWELMVRSWLTRHIEHYHGDAQTWLGQPLLMTRNTELVANGETGVIVERDGQLVAAIEQPDGVSYWTPGVLDGLTNAHAITIHKAQGSQFEAVSVILPPPGSPLLTRELLYTAVTRARSAVHLYGTPEAFASAVATPTRRTSGLRPVTEPRR